MTESPTVAVTAVGGRRGRVLSSDGALRLNLALVPSAADAATSPEQLLAAAYAASFLEAVRDAAGQHGQAVAAHCNVTALVGRGSTGPGLAVALDVDLPGIEQPLAEALVAAALQACPFSALLRDGTAVTVTIG